MIITDVSTIKLNLPTDCWELVVIDTDDGIKGWGEVTGSLDLDGLAHFVESAKSILIGKSPAAVNSLTSQLERWEYPSKANMRCFRGAVSGINQALWDLAAKNLNIPLYRMYGSEDGKKIKLYANLNKALRNDRRSYVMGQNAAKAYSEGFEFVKVTPFDELNPLKSKTDFSKAFEKMDAVVRSVPISHIAVDCHQRFNRFSYYRALNTIIEKYGIPFWIEDTVPVLDYESQKKIMQMFPGVMYAAGEDSSSFTQILKTIESGLYDVIMPDVKYIGGPSSVLPLFPIVESKGGFVSMHNPNGIISTAHSAHLMTLSRTDIPMEFPFAAVKDRADLSIPSEKVSNGFYELTDKPGIGVEIKQEVLLEYGLKYKQGEWGKC